MPLNLDIPGHDAPALADTLLSHFRRQDGGYCGAWVGWGFGEMGESVSRQFSKTRNFSKRKVVSDKYDYYDKCQAVTECTGKIEL